MTALSTHVLDTVRGEPASGLVVRLERVAAAGGGPGGAGTGSGPAGSGPAGSWPAGSGSAGSWPAGSGSAEIGRGETDADGRIADFGIGELPAGTYRLVFETGRYLAAAHPAAAATDPTAAAADSSEAAADGAWVAGQPGLAGGGPGPAAARPFFPEVVVTFTADGRRPRYHVPLLLSPYSYTTYRGS